MNRGRRLRIWCQRGQRLGERGVTLVEVLLTMGLLSIFMVVLTTVFTSAIDVQSQSNNYSALSAEGRFITSRLNFDIARATAIATPATLGASSANLVMTINGSTYTYVLNGTRLQLTDGTGTDFLTGDGVLVSALSFQRLGATGDKESIRYSFTITANAATHGSPEVRTFTTTVERR